MPNVESDDDENNDIYYMGDTDKREYLENFKFKKREDDDTTIIKKILKNSSSSINSSKSNSMASLDSNSNSKLDLSNSNEKNEGINSSSSSSQKDNNTEAMNHQKKSSKDDSENSQKSNSHLSPSKSKKGQIRKNAKKDDLDEEDQTEARYKIMKLNERERKEKLEKARERKDYLKNKDNGKFSKAALLSMLQQYGESINVEVFDQYFDELLNDSSSEHKQLNEFFSLDEFVFDILNFEEVLPQNLIEELNNSHDNHDSDINNNKSNTKWEDNEEDTEPYYVYTE
jgi:hypothetical protein